MDADAVLARLGEIFDADERAIAERLIGEHAGTIPDRQLLEEIGLAIAIHRRRWPTPPVQRRYRIRSILVTDSATRHSSPASPPSRTTRKSPPTLGHKSIAAG